MTICLYCSEEMVKRSQAKFCSNKCRTYYHRKETVTPKKIETVTIKETVTPIKPYIPIPNFCLLKHKGRGVIAKFCGCYN